MVDEGSQVDKPSKPTWKVRRMEKEDISQCLQVWAKVKLTEAHQTVSVALATDPEGFYVAELDGTVIGMCAGYMTRADTAFMGFYGVEPKYQRLGVGRELWQATIKRLESHCVNIGLYGVPTMFEKYKKSGFKIEDTIRMIVFESHSDSDLRLEMLKDSRDLAPNCRLEEIGCGTSNYLLDKLIEYDQSVQRFSREKLLRLYLTGDSIPLTLAVVQDETSIQVCSHPGRDLHQCERKLSCCAKPTEESIIEDEALSITAKSSLSLSSSSIDNSEQTGSELSNSNINCDGSRNQEILGYGCIRLDNNMGGIVGPIYADSSDICEVILRNLLARFNKPAEGIYSIMALSSNKQACKTLSRLGLAEEEQCSRLFSRFVPAATFSKIYYVHSPNFSLF